MELKWNDPLAGKRRLEPIVLDAAHLIAYDKAEVPAYKEGIILFVGKQVTPQDPMPGADLQTARIIHGKNVDEKKTDTIVTFRRWHEGDIVHQDEMLMMVDPAIPLNDLISKQAKIVAAKADLIAAEKTTLEANARWNRAQVIWQQKPQAISAEDHAAALLTWQKYSQEEVSKREGVTLAQIDADQAEIILRQHEIRNLGSPAPASSKRLSRTVAKASNRSKPS